MKTKSLKEGDISVNSAGVGTMTQKMVKKRAAELARMKGRSARNVIKADIEEARRELTGQGDADPKQEILEAAPESERWDPAPGSLGYKVRPVVNDDEDEEGRSDNERLVNEGVESAEHDQMRRASKSRNS